jgi:RNA polymerase sigma-70 factor (ECF subfamily)
MNRRKKLMTVQSKADDDFDILDSLPGEVKTEPEHRLNEQELNLQVLRMLAQLPMEQRLIVEYKIFQSLTFEEIAELQDMSVNTAKTRFYTALKKLKVVLEEANVLSQD